jgi:23S rRNA (cytosine1962-C5)-methyltransferase
VPDPGDVIEQCVARHSAQHGDACRLFHGRGHSYPGFEDLTVDWFPPYVVIGSFGADTALAGQVGAQLPEHLPGLNGVCVQARRGRATIAEVVWGEVPDEIVVSEAGIQFVVQPKRNQNVGLFLDMAPARTWLRSGSEGTNVLNLFAYTCAFSVAAMAGGAAQVVNNDMSRNALDWGRRNHELNDHDMRCVRMLPHNVFKSWWRIRKLGPYERIIIDPPSNQRGSFVAEKQYGQLLKRLPDFAAPGAQVLACLNSPFLPPHFLEEQMARWCPKCQLIDWLPPSADFPDRFPERGLKVAVFRYQR